MIGSAYKNFAQENGLKVDKGVGYGSIRGYWTTLSEGSGWKLMVINTKFPVPEKQDSLRVALTQVDIQKEYRVQKLDFTTNGITVVFQDIPGTMKKIQAFTDWFFPQLDAAEATKADICPVCGSPIVSDSTCKLMEGVSYHVHTACGEKMVRDAMQEDQDRKAADTGTYEGGAVGAFLGSLLGAVLWAIVLCAGYVASLVGLVIGFLAEKGYNLLWGKQGKGKIVILIFAVIFGVALGTVGAVLLQVFSLMGDGTIPGSGLNEAFKWMKFLLQDSEVQAALIKDCLTGLLFAGLGVAALIAQAAKKVSGTKISDLR